MYVYIVPDLQLQCHTGGQLKLVGIHASIQHGFPDTYVQPIGMRCICMHAYKYEAAASANIEYVHQFLVLR